MSFGEHLLCMLMGLLIITAVTIIAGLLLLLYAAAGAITSQAFGRGIAAAVGVWSCWRIGRHVVYLND